MVDGWMFGRWQRVIHGRYHTQKFEVRYVKNDSFCEISPYVHLLSYIFSNLVDYFQCLASSF